MLYDLLAVLLPFLGIAVSLLLAVCCVMLLIKRTQVVMSLLYLIVACAYSFALTKGLVWQSTGYVCALPQSNTMLLYAVVLVLFLLFIADRFRILRSLYKEADQKGADADGD